MPASSEPTSGNTVNAAASDTSYTAPKVRRCRAGINSAAIGNGEETANPPPNPVSKRTTMSCSAFCTSGIRSVKKVVAATPIGWGQVQRPLREQQQRAGHDEIVAVDKTDEPKLCCLLLRRRGSTRAYPSHAGG